jgi:hypothetical protein
MGSFTYCITSKLTDDTVIGGELLSIPWLPINEYEKEDGEDEVKEKRAVKNWRKNNNE